MVQDLRAEQFLEYMIEASSQKLATDVTGYAPANPGAAALMSPEQKRSLTPLGGAVPGPRTCGPADPR